jgi:hypothetical protein
VPKSCSLFVATPSGRLTLSAAWQRVAPYSSRRPPAASPSRRRGKESLLIRRNALRPPHPLGGVAKSRSLFVATPPSHRLG